jgi:hypothetical protein
VVEVGGDDAGNGVGEAAVGTGRDVATEPPVLHPAIPKASTTSPAANGVRIALKVKTVELQIRICLDANLRTPKSDLGPLRFTETTAHHSQTALGLPSS